MKMKTILITYSNYILLLLYLLWAPRTHVYFPYLRSSRPLLLNTLSLLGHVETKFGVNAASSGSTPGLQAS